jgi:hypothetical protein
VQSALHWSATNFVANPSGDAWVLDFSNDHVFVADKIASVFVWCVRGRQGADFSD